MLYRPLQYFLFSCTPSSTNS